MNNDWKERRDRIQATIPRLSRLEFFSRRQIKSSINDLFEQSYKRVLFRRYVSKSHDSPHGFRWHTSIHASQYPGNYKHACQREHLYRLADVPSKEPASRRLHLTAQAGLAIEDDLVRMLEENGRLISAGPDSERQTGFVVKELWLTGTVDSAIAIGNRAVPVEIKTKWEGHIAEMREGKRGPDAKHVRQLKAQLGLIRLAQESGELWSDLKPATYGYIYYHPRDSKYNPSKPVETAEFYVSFDKDYFEAGTDFIRRTQELWNRGELPSDNPNKRHPMGWHWSKDPCMFCNYKPSCQKDHKEGITELEASNALQFAKHIDPDYDYIEARSRVADRWPDAEVSATIPEA